MVRFWPQTGAKMGAGHCVDSSNKQGDGAIDGDINSYLLPPTMHRILDKVQEVAEWVTAVEEVVQEEISWFSAIPDPNPEDQE